MKWLFVIPVCERDRLGYQATIDSILINLPSLNPQVVAVVDPRDDWRPDGEWVLGPPVHQNIRGIAWLREFHRICGRLVEQHRPTHLLKTDADVLWISDHLSAIAHHQAFGFLRHHNSAITHWMGMGYGWQASVFLELLEKWQSLDLYSDLPDQESAPEDQSSFKLTTQFIEPVNIERAHGINWNQFGENEVTNCCALHCGQNFHAKWGSSGREMMNQAMFRLWEWIKQA